MTARRFGVPGLQLSPGDHVGTMCRQAVRRHPQQVLTCRCHLELAGGGIIVDLQRTHPRVLLGGLLLDSPHFVSPECWET